MGLVTNCDSTDDYDLSDNYVFALGNYTIGSDAKFSHSYSAAIDATFCVDHCRLKEYKYALFGRDGCKCNHTYEFDVARNEATITSPVIHMVFKIDGKWANWQKDVQNRYICATAGRPSEVGEIELAERDCNEKHHYVCQQDHQVECSQKSDYILMSGIPSNRRCIFRSTNKHGWLAALENCMKIDGQLWVAHQDYETVQKFLEVGTQSYWIGLHRNPFVFMESYSDYRPWKHYCFFKFPEMPDQGLFNYLYVDSTQNYNWTTTLDNDITAHSIVRIGEDFETDTPQGVPSRDIAANDPRPIGWWQNQQFVIDGVEYRFSDEEMNHYKAVTAGDMLVINNADVQNRVEKAMRSSGITKLWMAIAYYPQFIAKPWAWLPNCDDTDDYNLSDNFVIDLGNYSSESYVKYSHSHSASDATSCIDYCRTKAYTYSLFGHDGCHCNHTFEFFRAQNYATTYRPIVHRVFKTDGKWANWHKDVENGHICAIAGRSSGVGAIDLAERDCNEKYDYVCQEDHQDECSEKSDYILMSGTPSNRQCIFKSTNKRDWFGAIENCRKIGGQLWVAYQDYETVESFLDVESQGYWVGLHRNPFVRMTSYSSAPTWKHHCFFKFTKMPDTTKFKYVYVDSSQNYNWMTTLVDDFTAHSIVRTEKEKADDKNIIQEDDADDLETATPQVGPIAVHDPHDGIFYENSPFVIDGVEYRFSHEKMNHFKAINGDMLVINNADVQNRVEKAMRTAGITKLWMAIAYHPAFLARPWAWLPNCGNTDDYNLSDNFVIDLGNYSTEKDVKFSHSHSAASDATSCLDHCRTKGYAYSFFDHNGCNCNNTYAFSRARNYATTFRPIVHRVFKTDGKWANWHKDVENIHICATAGRPSEVGAIELAERDCNDKHDYVCQQDNKNECSEKSDYILMSVTPSNRRCIFKSTNKRDWFGAIENCRKIGGQLWVAYQDYQTVERFLEIESQGYWVGLHRNPFVRMISYVNTPPWKHNCFFKFTKMPDTTKFKYVYIDSSQHYHWMTTLEESFTAHIHRSY